MEQTLVQTYLRALKAGNSLERLVPVQVDGRTDLRGLRAPDPKILRAKNPLGVFGTLDELNVFSDVRWQSLDFCRSKLPSFRFTRCSIQDVVFDSCDCRDWRLWSTSVVSTSFREADLRGAALGALLRGQGNIFRRVCFDRADMRNTAYASADFIDCTFRNCRLDGVEFGGSRFVNCVFEGELRDVVFARHGFGAEKQPPNQMVNVDFRRARFSFVSFRGLDLEQIMWPDSKDHIIIDHFPEVLDHLIAVFRNQTTDYARGFVGLFENHKKWLGKNQRRGVMSRSEIVEEAGEIAWEQLVEALARFPGAMPN